MTRIVLSIALLLAVAACSPPSDRSGCNVWVNPLECSI